MSVHKQNVIHRRLYAYFRLHRNGVSDAVSNVWFFRDYAILRATQSRGNWLVGIPV